MRTLTVADTDDIATIMSDLYGYEVSDSLHGVAETPEEWVLGARDMGIVAEMIDCAERVHADVARIVRDILEVA